MKTTMSIARPRPDAARCFALLALAGAIALTPVHSAVAQKPPTSTELQKQIGELKTELAKLQAAVTQLSGGAAGSTMGTAPKKPGGMSMMMDKGEMGMPPDGMKMPAGMMEKMEKMEKMDMMEMGGMKSGAGGMAGMTKPAADTGMTGMGGATTSPMAGMARGMSALPGFPGLSHLYHIGATGFFLDQSVITLADGQEKQLNEIRTRALLARSESDRRIAQLEEELWTLTAEGEPDATKVEAKIQDIERARASARMAFIRAVGDASKVLTPAQRQQLLGAATK